MRTPRNIPITVFLILSYVQLFLTQVIADPIAKDCSIDLDVANDIFATNLKKFLFQVASKSLKQSFGNYTVGESPYCVYGLFQCRGDITQAECRVCIDNARIEIRQACPSVMQAVVWYDGCQLRYSHRCFFGLAEVSGELVNKDYYTNLTKDEQKKVMWDVAHLVKKVPYSPAMFATMSWANESVYSLAQCTFDLSKDGCKGCLENVMNNISSRDIRYRGWQYYTPSCSIRYENYPFFNGSKLQDKLQRKLCSDDETQLSAQFRENLIRVWHDLTKDKAIISGFGTSDYGEDPDHVYALIQCRGDIDPHTCSDCIATAISDTQYTCPNKTQVMLWYYNCYLRYSNENFYGITDTQGNFTCSTIYDTSTIDLQQSIYTVAGKASDKKLLFNYLKLNNESITRIYYAQCTRDLDGSKCSACLNELIPEALDCCYGKQWWSYFAASCSITYQMQVNDSSPSSLTPAPQPFPNEGDHDSRERRKPRRWILIVCLLATFLGISCGVCCIFHRLCAKKKLQKEKAQSDCSLFDDLSPWTRNDLAHINMCEATQANAQKLPSINLHIIQQATNNFSCENKLGEGGFGAVYKGTLPDGKEIAVKRFTKGSRQGLKEFKNEVIIIARLQHENLIRLLFCCKGKQENLLVYEYMPNRSLDTFLFDPVKHEQLDWRRRVNIVSGIAQGLFYLHEKSRLKIIHRDLKASNILLDHEMNPKISDFGIARTFRENRGEEKTKKVMGTYGYMAPEYVLCGLFSVKSDVFSFGVLLLEIISGKRNNDRCFADNAVSLISYAWMLWCDGKVMQLIDPMLIDFNQGTDVLRLIHIGLLCVQEKAADRPTMSSVVLMLESNSMILSQPTEPPLYNCMKEISFVDCLNKAKTCSPNNVTISDFEPR